MAKQKQSGLGRGIDALFGDMGLEEENTENIVQMIDIGLIDPNKEQPRKRFDADALSQLADSIRSVGVIQPIVLSPNGRRYTIIAGERRWRAARLAELKEIPALVREVETVRRMEMSLIENIQRTDLNAIEEAQAIDALMQQCGLTQEQAAQRLGKSRSAVANLLRLLSLPEGVAQLRAERGPCACSTRRAERGRHGLSRREGRGERAQCATDRDAGQELPSGPVRARRKTPLCGAFAGGGSCAHAVRHQSNDFWQ